MPVLVLHGESDAVVRPVNGAQAGVKWIETKRLAGADVGEPLLETIDGATVESYRDTAGNVLVEHWRIATLGHAWSGGSAAGTYTSPEHVDAGPVVVRFLLHHALERAAAP
jgi:poly(3-hydroxybutyrate) depolymerase